MNYYVYGFKQPNSGEYLVLECDSDKPIFKTGQFQKLGRFGAYEGSEDYAKDLANANGTVAFPYTFHSWLYYRAMEVTGNLWVLRKPGASTHMVEVTSNFKKETKGVSFPTVEMAELAMELITKLFNSRAKPSSGGETVEDVDYSDIEFVHRNTLCGVPTIGGILSDYGVTTLIHYGHKDHWLLPVTKRLLEAYMNKQYPKFAVVNLRGTRWEHTLPEGVDGACVTEDEFLAMGLPEAPNWVPDGAGH